MPAGFLQTTYVCVPKVPNTGASTAPCSTVGLNRYVPVEQTSYVLFPSSAAAIDAVAAPVDYASLGSLWGFSFTASLILWMLAKKAGIVVQAVRGM